MRVPLFNNSLILKQLGLAIGIPFSVLAIFLIVIKAYYGLLMLGATFVLAFLLVWLVFGGAYAVRFKLDEDGILCENQESQRKNVRLLSLVTFLMGMSKGDLTAAGAGLLAGASTRVMIPWRQINKVRYDEGRRQILIYAGMNNHVALFCTAENYGEVERAVNEMVSSSLRKMPRTSASDRS